MVPFHIQGVSAKNLSYYQSKSLSAERNSQKKIPFIKQPRPRKGILFLKFFFTKNFQKSNRRPAVKNSPGSCGINSCQDFSIFTSIRPQKGYPKPQKTLVFTGRKRSFPYGISLICVKGGTRNSRIP